MPRLDQEAYTATDLLLSDGNHVGELSHFEGAGKATNTTVREGDDAAR